MSNYRGYVAFSKTLNESVIEPRRTGDTALARQRRYDGSIPSSVCVELLFRFGLIIAGLTTGGFASADTQKGKILAQRWCSTCHQISQEQPVVMMDVPSFMAIARKHGKDIRVLESFLSHPHSAMPDWNLSRQEIRNIVDYIATLR